MFQTRLAISSFWLESALMNLRVSGQRFLMCRQVCWGLIHSLLKLSFGFAAVASIASEPRKYLRMKGDFEDLLTLGGLFDEAKEALKPLMASFRLKLQDELSLHISVNDDLDPVCRSDFAGAVSNYFPRTKSDT